ncbi:MAG: cytochrome c biogenesis protein CcsA [Deltaproteobacteria bacterium]|nr:cytochrome c biogenesis protein CcsA [Deltaproteobacteria bacterium]
MSRYAAPLFALLGAIGFAVTIWMIFTDTPLQFSWQPNERHVVLATGSGSLFFNQKIFFWHVPHAIMLFLAVGVAGVSSIGFLTKRNPKWDDVALASVEVAVAFGAVTLLTGMIWAKAAWGHWWIWEKRLTMSLLLWMTLVGYTIVRRFAGASGERIAAAMAVFAMIGVPFIYTMVGAGDNHPQAGSEGNVATLNADMRPAFWSSMVTFLCWFLALVITRVQSARMQREVRELREKGLDAGVLE